MYIYLVALLGQMALGHATTVPASICERELRPQTLARESIARLGVVNPGATQIRKSLSSSLLQVVHLDNDKPVGAIDFSTSNNEITISKVEIDNQKPNDLAELLMAHALLAVPGVERISAMLDYSGFDTFYAAYQQFATNPREFKVMTTPIPEHLRYFEKKNSKFVPTDAEINAIRSLPIVGAAERLGFSKLTITGINWGTEVVTFVLDKTPSALD